MDRIGILGTGLIGASIGMAARETGSHVTGWDISTENLASASKRGAIDVPADDLAALLAASNDLLVVAAPPSETVKLVATLDHAGLTIDVSGVKAPILDAAMLPRFVGTHPMAGREVSGPEAASPALFRGATWVVVGGEAAQPDIEEVSRFIASLGGRPVEMRAATHDAAVAAVSHMPQLLASSLVFAAAGTDDALNLAAGSFRDLTRVASSDPSLWVDLLRTNRDAVARSIQRMRASLDEFDAALHSDPEELEGLLAKSREIRRSMIARVGAVRVALADQPGELAKVGRAFEATSVDVRDIQLRHAPHGGGGVLTISIRPGHAEALTHALKAEGLFVVG